MSDVADVTSCVDHTKGGTVGQVSSGGGGLIDPATNTKLGHEGEDNQLNQITAKIKGKIPDLKARIPRYPSTCVGQLCLYAVFYFLQSPFCPTMLGRNLSKLLQTTSDCSTVDQERNNQFWQSIRCDQWPTSTYVIFTWAIWFGNGDFATFLQNLVN